MAEWLGTALQKLLQRFESAFDLLENTLTPVNTTFQGFCFYWGTLRGTLAGSRVTFRQVK